jgi:glycosyltransferase involved in cell wall biosynthesis
MLLSKEIEMTSNRLAFVLPSFGKGGAQRATISLANYFMANGGCDVTLIALKDDFLEFELHKDIKLVKLNSQSFKASLKKLVTAFKDCQPNVVYSALWHVNLLVLISKLILFLTIRLKFKHIASVHNNPSMIIQTENKYLAISYYYFFARFSDKIVAVSKGIEKHLVEKCRIPVSKIVMAYNPAITDGHARQLVEQVNIPFAEKYSGEYLLWVGRLDYQKDPIKFLEILKLLELPGILVGDGPLESDVRDFIVENNLQEKVLYLPFQENVVYLMARANLLLMTSRFEGFGLVLVESLFAGTPVVSTNCLYGPAEIILDGKNGLLLDENANAEEFSKAVELLRSDAVLYKAMRECAAESVDCFRDSVVFEQYKGLFL